MRFERAFKLAPDAAEIQNIQAMILLADGEAPDALRINDSILERVAGYRQFALHEAWILAALDRWNEALTALDTLLAVDKLPENAVELREQRIRGSRLHQEKKITLMYDRVTAGRQSHSG